MRWVAWNPLVAFTTLLLLLLLLLAGWHTSL
jgi:hypothetical protein